MYSDEITPGNALKIKNMQRLQAIYYTFQNLGPRSMACEALWFPLIVLRSSLCTALGGLTVLWKYALKAFFGDHDLTAGWFLQTPEVGLMLYGRLGIFVADEAALKHTVESKGAAGVVFCMRCSNVVSHNSSAADHNPDALPSTCTDATKFRLHTNQTTRALLEYLAAEQPDSSKARFKSLRTALGFNLVAEGLLMDDLGYSVPEAIMYDWFHIYLVHGIVGRDLGLLLGTLRTAGIQEDDITDFLQSFRWPTQFAGADCKGILKNSSRETIPPPLKAGASELVNFLPIMRLSSSSLFRARWTTTPCKPPAASSCLWRSSISSKRSAGALRFRHRRFTRPSSNTPSPYWGLMALPAGPPRTTWPFTWGNSCNDMRA